MAGGMVAMADFTLCTFCPDTHQLTNAAQSTELGFRTLASWPTDRGPCACLPPSLGPVLSSKPLPWPL